MQILETGQKCEFVHSGLVVNQDTDKTRHSRCLLYNDMLKQYTSSLKQSGGKTYGDKYIPSIAVQQTSKVHGQKGATLIHLKSFSAG